MPNKSKILAASGHKPYDYLMRPEYVNGFLTTYVAESLVNQITTTVAESKNITYMQEYIFKERPQAEWFDLRKNQAMEPSELNVTTKSMIIGRMRAYLLKVDSIDTMTIPEFSSYIKEWEADAKQQLAIYIDYHVINAMAHEAAQCNKGVKAGARTAKYNMGKTGSPVIINADSILTKIMQLGLVLDEQNAPKIGRFLILPPEAKMALATHPMFMSQCASGSIPMLLSEKVPNISGFTVYFPTNMPSYTEVNGDKAYPIIAGLKQATYYAMGMTDVEANVGEARTFGKYWKGRAVFDWKVVRPEFLAVAYATIETA